MTEATNDIVETIIERYDRDADMLIPILQDLQEELGYLPQKELVALGDALSIPVSRIYGVATFYSSLRLVPQGKHDIQLCMGTVCFLKGAGRISEAIQQTFDVAPGGVSPDGMFTFSPVNCLGACALAPVMTVDGAYHGGLTVDSAIELLNSMAASEPVEAQAGSGGSDS